MVVFRRGCCGRSVARAWRVLCTRCTSDLFKLGLTDIKYSLAGGVVTYNEKECPCVAR